MSDLASIVTSDNALVLEILTGILLLAVVIVGRRVEARIGRVHIELRPNGGSSLRDAIDRIEQRVTILEKRADPILPTLDEINKPSTS